MLPFRLVYSDGYDLNVGDHVFQGGKYRLIHDRLLRERFAQASDFVEPRSASVEDLCLAHDPEWIARLTHGTLSFHETMRLEMPFSLPMVRAFFLMAGGTILAARNALADGLGFNVGGGFHHGFRAYGEGFCAINDVAVAVRRLQKDGDAGKVMVVDTDVHQGNGTASIFAGDATVFTLSIHHLNNYPHEKPPSNIDVNLDDGVADEEYLRRLEDALIPALDRFRPDFLMHVSGADPYMEDQLGGLLLTYDGLARRDRLIYEAARQRRIPVCVTLAGGYAFNPHDTITIHANTAKVAAEVFLATPDRR